MRWALMMIRLAAACRNTSVSRTTGTTPEPMMSASTCPGPTDGNWSMSPTISSAAWSGIGFKSADAIAMKLGIEKTAMIRLRAGISYALTEAMDEGHCGLPTDQLIPLAEELLEAPRALIRTALDLELQEGTVV